MLAILNSLNAHNFPIFQPILMILVSKFMVYGALSDKTYLLLGLLSPLNLWIYIVTHQLVSAFLSYCSQFTTVSIQYPYITRIERQTADLKNI